MRIFFSALTSTVLAAGLSLASTSLHAESSCGQVAQWPGASWSAPTSGGWNAALLTKAQQISSEQGGDAAVMVVHRGQLIAHWGETNTPRLVQSVRKQLLSGLIGQEVAAGRLDLQASLQELGIDDEAPPLRPEQRQARVQDLLESRSGIFQLLRHFQHLFARFALRDVRSVRNCDDFLLLLLVFIRGKSSRGSRGRNCEHSREPAHNRRSSTR